MLSQFWSRRLGNIMVLAGLGICTTAIFMVMNSSAFAQSVMAGAENGDDPQGARNAEDQWNDWLGGDWQLGASGRISSNPYRGADSADLNGLPMIAYDAERLHVGIDGIDAKLWKNQYASLSVLGNLRLEPFDNDDSSYLNGLYDRDIAFEAGVGGTVRLWRGELEASVMGDVNDAYGGYVADVSYYLPTQWQQFRFNVGGGLTWQSEELVDYNVGVRRNEVRGDRGFYNPDAALIPHLDFRATMPITRQFALVGNTGVEFLPDEYTDSPIIDDDYIFNVGLSAVYSF
ncbi:MipA/OmpV family protein [Thalassospira sp. MA62]|nr:MipA/OmpV family protein [Thalassospira sp. MA62]